MFIKEALLIKAQIYRKNRKLRIWSHLLKKSFMENIIFCAVKILGTDSFLVRMQYTLQPSQSAQETPNEDKNLSILKEKFSHVNLKSTVLQNSYENSKFKVFFSLIEHIS